MNSKEINADIQARAKAIKAAAKAAKRGGACL